MACSSYLCYYYWDSGTNTYEFADSYCYLEPGCSCPAPPSSFQGSSIQLNCVSSQGSSSTSTTTTTPAPTTTTTSTTTTAYPGGPLNVFCPGACYYQLDSASDEYVLTYSTCPRECACEEVPNPEGYGPKPDFLITNCVQRHWSAELCNLRKCIVTQINGKVEILQDQCRPVGCICPGEWSESLTYVSYELRPCKPRPPCAWRCDDLGGGDFVWTNLYKGWCTECQEPTLRCNAATAGTIKETDCLIDYCENNFILLGRDVYVDGSGQTQVNWYPLSFPNKPIPEQEINQMKQYLEGVALDVNLIALPGLENPCLRNKCIYKCEYNPSSGLYEPRFLVNSCSQCNKCSCETSFCNNCTDPNIYIVSYCNSEYDRKVYASPHSELGCTYYCDKNTKRLKLYENNCENSSATCMDLSDQICSHLPSDEFIFAPCYYKLRIEDDCDRSRCAYTCEDGAWVRVSNCIRKVLTGPGESDFTFIQSQCDCPEPDYSCSACEPNNPTIYQWVGCIGTTTTTSEPTTTTPGPSTTTSSTTTTTRRPDCINSDCVYKCDGQAWQLLTNVQEPCFCAPPEEPCTYDSICAEVVLPPWYQAPEPPPPPPASSTSSSEPSAPDPHETDPCENSFCRWYCTYIENEFSWLLVQPCASGCRCQKPINQCDQGNACSYVVKNCIEDSIPESPEPTCGSCTYICIDGQYYISNFLCTGSCTCPTLPFTCSRTGDILIWACTDPNTTTTTAEDTTTTTGEATTTTTEEPTTTTTSFPTSLCGYCKYLGTENSMVIVENNCTGTCTCPEIIITNVQENKYYYIGCSDDGGELLRLTDPLSIILNLEEPEVEIVETTTTVEASTTTTTENPCQGLCHYLWSGAFWVEILNTCNCNCWPPEGVGQAGVLTPGTCRKEIYIDEELPTLTWMPEVEITTTTTTEEPPPEYPNGYCMYKCGFGNMYFLYYSECAVDYSCVSFVQLPCEQGEIMYVPCTPTGTFFVDLGFEPSAKIKVQIGSVSVSS